GLRVPIVVPAGQRRQGHQDGFGAPAGLQPEERAAVVEKIEFDIPSAAVQLESPFAFAPGLMPPPRDYGQIGRQEVVADAAQKVEAARESSLAQIVEEQAADPTR